MISQAENECEACGGFHRLPFARGWFETRLFCSAFRGAVEILETAGADKPDAGRGSVRCHGHIEYHRSLLAAASCADGVGWPDRAVERRVRVDVA